MDLYEVFRGTQRGFIVAVPAKAASDGIMPARTATERAELVLQEPVTYLGPAAGRNHLEAEEAKKRELALKLD
jgi:hypothetical protein